MKNNHLPDHKTLSELAENSPDKLEFILRENINALIESTSGSHKRRLQGLQFQIDVQRKLAKNPVDSCIRISRMMHDSFIELNTALKNFTKNQPMCDKKKDSNVIYLTDRK
jgi:chromosome condensin MukBEF complex kleisin-like MukF subunit